jgi:hypothetical protein
MSGTFVDPYTLTFKYKRGSTLPERTFVITTRRCPSPACDPRDDVYVQVTVVAPDPVTAVKVLDRNLRGPDGLLDGWHWHREPGMVREVTRGWDGNGYNAPVVRVCEAY